MPKLFIKNMPKKTKKIRAWGIIYNTTHLLARERDQTHFALFDTKEHAKEVCDGIGIGITPVTITYEID